MRYFTVSSSISSLMDNQRPLGWTSNTLLLLFEVNLTIPIKFISICITVIKLSLELHLLAGMVVILM
ncbi:unnamed protein product [Phytomonas sp. Hart1]|nr:unnamed protein product [Phytomonas sp. Hart1]|eukprot:CCW67527.1 unnamed protein product [Phytomonas sp. isolate Hart1]